MFNKAPLKVVTLAHLHPFLSRVERVHAGGVWYADDALLVVRESGQSGSNRHHRALFFFARFRFFRVHGSPAGGGGVVEAPSPRPHNQLGGQANPVVSCDHVAAQGGTGPRV